MTPTPDFPGPFPIHAKAPNVAIIGLDIVREMTQFTDDVTDADVFSWEIKGVPMPMGDGTWLFRLFGDLYVRQGNAIGAATSVATIVFRGPARPKLTAGHWTSELVTEYTEIYGSWLAHALYDVAAAAVRRMSAQSHADSVDVPVETPEPQYLGAA
jgi:hypothetical protein